MRSRLVSFIPSYTSKMSTSYRMYTVDSFTDKSFSGNPAGVCLLMGAKLEDSVLKKIAAEMRHSETAFVSTHPEHTDAHPIFGLRWFTPTVEVNLCGTRLRNEILLERCPINFCVVSSDLLLLYLARPRYSCCCSSSLQ